jgi:hypothetical protein
MPHDPTRIEGEELGRHTPDEVPSAVTAGEKIRHGTRTLLDVLLDV